MATSRYLTIVCCFAFGCFETKVVNSDSGGAGQGGGGGSGSPGGVNVAACRSCAESACPSETSACEKASGCVEFIDCNFGCEVTDVACKTACNGGGNGGAPSIDAASAAALLSACAYVECANECLPTEPGEGGAGGDGGGAGSSTAGRGGGSNGGAPQGGAPNGGTAGLDPVGGSGGSTPVPGVNWLTFDGSRADASLAPNDAFGVDGVLYAYGDGCSDVLWDPVTRCASGFVCAPNPPLYSNWGVAVGFDFRNTGETGTPPNTKFTWNPTTHGVRGVAWQLRGASVPAVQLWMLNMDPSWGGQCPSDSCDIAGPPDGTSSPGSAGQLLFSNMIKDDWGGSGVFYVYDPAAVHAMQFKIPAIVAGGASFEFCVDRIGLVR